MHPIPLKPFYFLRHGETDWNNEHKTMGSQDIPLNERGLTQALSVSKLLKHELISTIVSSPLLRARKTADIVHQSIAAPVIEIPQFQEACWGEKEGMPRNDDVWIHDWQEGSEIKNAEKYTDFLIRVSLGLKKALQYEGPVLIVSHGIVYWAVREILGLAIIDLGNCETIFHKPPKYPNNSWSVYPI